MKKTILAGVTPDDELYFLEIDPKSATHDYFAMSGFTVTPLNYGEAVEQTRERLEDGELWRMAVEDKSTTLELDEWIDYVLETDGEISMIDNSHFPETITANGVDYIFESGSCGQHEEKELKEYFIQKNIFNTLMRTWEQYHLKKIDVMLPNIPKQDITQIIQNWLERNK
jgi:hypothetical protein